IAAHLFRAFRPAGGPPRPVPVLVDEDDRHIVEPALRLDEPLHALVRSGPGDEVPAIRCGAVTFLPPARSAAEQTALRPREKPSQSHMHPCRRCPPLHAAAPAPGCDSAIARRPPPPAPQPMLPIGRREAAPGARTGVLH